MAETTKSNLNHVLYVIILLLGLFPATFLFILMIQGMTSILTWYDLHLRIAFIMISFILGMAGYIGLFTALIAPRKYKLNSALLLFGLVGFSIFMSLEGGITAWKWFLFIEEPDEWFILGLPIISALVGLIVNVRRIALAKKTLTQ